MACEYGFYHKMNSKQKNWSRLISVDINIWKEIVKKIMEQYVERTEGSYIESKESSIIWKHPGNIKYKYLFF